MSPVSNPDGQVRTSAAQNIKIFTVCSAASQQWGREAAFAPEQLPADWRDGARPGSGDWRGAAWICLGFGWNVSGQSTELGWPAPSAVLKALPCRAEPAVTPQRLCCPESFSEVPDYITLKTKEP